MPLDAVRVAVFSTKPYDVQFLETATKTAAAEARIEFSFQEGRLNRKTAKLAEGCQVVCAFVNDEVCAETVAKLHKGGTGLIALRCAGFNNVDLAAAGTHGLAVGRVPAYSPHAVAEHTVALIMALNRKTHRAFNRIREGNFALDGLMGTDLYGKTAGIIGTGLIGFCLAQILKGFGCRVLAFDPHRNPDCERVGVEYVELAELFAQSDVISLQCPLNPKTHHLINDDTIAQMKHGTMLINTSRGAVIDTEAVLRGLKSGKIGALGLDVYEEESELFFEDMSNTFIPDDLFARLLTFPNVLITGHQGFFTQEALSAIAATTVENILSFMEKGAPEHPVRDPGVTK